MREVAAGASRRPSGLGLSSSGRRPRTAAATRRESSTTRTLRRPAGDLAQTDRCHDVSDVGDDHLGRSELVGRRLVVVALLVVAGSVLVGATR